MNFLQRCLFISQLMWNCIWSLLTRFKDWTSCFLCGFYVCAYACNRNKSVLLTHKLYFKKQVFFFSLVLYITTQSGIWFEGFVQVTPRVGCPKSKLLSLQYHAPAYAILILILYSFACVKVQIYLVIAGGTFC